MAQNSKISWCTHTANLWWGCSVVHSGCDNCYAEVLSKRFGDNVWGNTNPRREIKSVWKDLVKYQKLAKAAGEVHKVFVGSMMDIFEKPMPMVNNKGEAHPESTGFLRRKLFELISAGEYPNLMFLLLTKRPSNINKYIPESWKENPPENVMFGTSPVNRETFSKLTSQLLEVNGKRFLSIEPQLGELTLFPLLSLTIEMRTGKAGSAIDWVIQGGESGANRRPFNLDWAYKIKEECKRAGVPYFFKQIDKVQEIPADLMVREFPTF